MSCSCELWQISKERVVLCSAQKRKQCQCSAMNLLWELLQITASNGQKIFPCLVQFLGCYTDSVSRHFATLNKTEPPYVQGWLRAYGIWIHTTWLYAEIHCLRILESCWFVKYSERYALPRITVWVKGWGRGWNTAVNSLDNVFNLLHEIRSLASIVTASLALSTPSFTLLSRSETSWVHVCVFGGIQNCIWEEGKWLEMNKIPFPICLSTMDTFLSDSLFLDWDRVTEQVTVQ